MAKLRNSEIRTTFWDETEANAVAKAKAAKEGGGIVVSKREDLPTLDEGTTYEAYYVEETIMGTVGNLLNLTHSGLVLKNPQNETAGAPKAMTFQYYGVTFGADVLVPRVLQSADGATSLEWRNNSMICYSPTLLPPSENGQPRWQANTQHVGSVTGTAFNRWCEWVATYAACNPGYQMWDVWDDADTRFAYHHLKGSKCDEFVQAALIELHRLGAPLCTEATLYMDSIPFLCKEGPSPIDMSDSDAADEVLTFYERLSALGSSLSGGAAADGGMSLPTLLRTLATSLDVWIVYERRTNTYYRAKLSPPYMCLDKFYQPMVLPWQARSDGEAHVSTIGEYDAGAMISGIARHAGNALRERLPRIALGTAQRRRIRTAAAAVLAFTLGMPLALHRYYPSSAQPFALKASWPRGSQLVQVAADVCVASGSLQAGVECWVKMVDHLNALCHPALWYVAGIVNGLVLLPILLLVLGERKFR